MRNRLLTLGIVLLATASTLMAQFTATGNVTDESGEPIVGAAVREVGTDNAVATDMMGDFTIEVASANSMLSVESLGMETMEFQAGSMLELSMKSNATQLGGTVVSASKRSEKVIDAPASVTVINSAELAKTVAIVPTDHLTKVAGVDVMKTGLVGVNVNIRGFNNIFSGAMLTVVDDRIGRVPSLRVNAFQLMPTTPGDIESMEIVRGPASALYGPNAADGVFAIRTKSPLDQENKFETTVSMTMGVRGQDDGLIDAQGISFTPTNTSFGSRMLYSPEIRHSAKLSDKFGYKISGRYLQGNDFEYQDPREPAFGDDIIFGTVQDGGAFVVDNERGIETFSRDYGIQTYNVDGRIDYAPSQDFNMIANFGLANTTNIELTGLGAAQGINWNYYTGQLRMNYKNWFAQYYINASNAGDTYLLPQSGGEPQPHAMQLLIDKSKLHVAQIQGRMDKVNNFDLIYGFDYIGTRPNTEGTINGRFEDNDNINQYGGYGQAEYKMMDGKLSFLGALRLDYQDRIQEFQVSPRAAIVYKPASRHTLRGTYNRAFSAPTSLNFSLDLASAFLPNGVTIRGYGNSTGFDYRYDANGLPQFRSPGAYNIDFDNNPLNDWGSFGNTADNYRYFGAMADVLGSELAKLSESVNAGQVALVLNTLSQGLWDDASGSIQNADQMVIDLATLSATGGDYGASTIDINAISDLDAVQSSITQTYEVGYKGIISDKLFLTTDLYYQQISNFTSPLTTASYSVIFEPTSLAGVLGVQDFQNSTLYQNYEALPNDIKDLLTGLLDGNPDYTGSTFNQIQGTGADELANTIMSQLNVLGLGVIVPDQDQIGSDVILTYLNLGQVNFWGGDIQFKYLPKENFAINGAFSFLNKNEFELEGVAGGVIPLNAARFRGALGLDYTFPKCGLGFSTNWRWSDAFPANSAIYQGTVVAQNLLDLGIRYTPTWAENTTLTLDMTNVLGTDLQRFPGTPEIGRVTMLRLAQKF